jgi:hypothetical protein
VQATGKYPGDDAFEAAETFSKLQQILRAAHDLMVDGNGTLKPIRRIVQFTPPTWAITDFNLLSIDPAIPYDIDVRKIPMFGFEATESDDSNPRWDASFRNASSDAWSLHDSGRLANKPPSSRDDPPF